MVFGNLETMKRLVDELLAMDREDIDAILMEHDWASDHISVATENLEQVFDFLAGHENPEHEMEHEMGEHEMMDDNEMEEEMQDEEESEEMQDEEEMGGIKSFNNFQN